MKTLPTWKLTYWIEDDSEYSDYILRKAAEMTDASAAAAIAAWWCGGDDPADEKAFAQALLKDGYV